MITEAAFNIFLIAMSITALVVFVVLHYIDAGYGMMYTRKWGPTVNNRVGWIIMESPVFVAMFVLWWFSDRKSELVPLLFLLLFELHYFQRSFVFPFLIRGNSKMPLSIIFSGVVFNMFNAFMQGGWIFYISPEGSYPVSWITDIRFIIGVIVFFVGMTINLHSDNVVRNLRKPGDTKHYIPRGGMYKYVSSANYFGEFVEWCGFAILTWSYAGAVFALWTFANLAPRAKRINNRYRNEFGEEFTKLKLKNIIPFIY
ncbi:MAG: DUF1295 domain-containing protein [Muribaculaceae bacterium]|nr:DUF1295 domain-containing protein [Muribaculaceae bacterium]